MRPSISASRNYRLHARRHAEFLSSIASCLRYVITDAELFVGRTGTHASPLLESLPITPISHTTNYYFIGRLPLLDFHRAGARATSEATCKGITTDSHDA